MWALIFLSCCLSVCQQRCHLVHFCVLSEVLDPRGAGSVVVLTGVELHLCQEGIPPGGGRNLRSSLSLRGRTWKTLNCCLASFFLSFFLSLPCMNLKCALLSRHLEQNHQKILLLSFLFPLLLSIQSARRQPGNSRPQWNHSFSQLTEVCLLLEQVQSSPFSVICFVYQPFKHVLFKYLVFSPVCIFQGLRDHGFMVIATVD